MHRLTTIRLAALTDPYNDIQQRLDGVGSPADVRAAIVNGLLSGGYVHVVGEGGRNTLIDHPSSPTSPNRAGTGTGS